MSQEVRGVIARSKGAPVELVTVIVPDPGPGEAVVKIQACGVCHTDLHYREGGIGEDYPYLLGHEAAGSTLVHRPAATSVLSMYAPMPSAGDSSVPSSRVIFCFAL